LSIIRISNNKVDPPGVVVGNVVQTGLGGSASEKKLKMKGKK